MDSTAIKRFRLSKGISQEKMARAIDVTLTTYAKAEKSGIAGRIFINKMMLAFPNDDIVDLFFPRRMLGRQVSEIN